MITKNEKLTVEKAIKIKAPVSKVWDALTNPELIKQYFFGTTAVSDWKVGSPLYFRGEWEGQQYEDKGTIIASEPNKLFKYNYWSSVSGTEDIPENYALITYMLTESGDQTMLTVIQDGILTQEKKEHSEQGWDAVLNDLKEIVEKES